MRGPRFLSWKQLLEARRTRGPDSHPAEVEIHTADVSFRARARPAALVRRPRALALRRLSGLIQRLAARMDPADAAAYDEAARKAVQAVTSQEAPRPLAPAPAAPAAAPPVASVLAPTDSTALRRFEVGAARPGASDFVPAVPTAVTAAPAAAPTNAPVSANRRAGPLRPEAGDSAPNFPLRTPTSATMVADDFFDSLIRRVEGDR